MEAGHHCGQKDFSFLESCCDMGTMREGAGPLSAQPIRAALISLLLERRLFVKLIGCQNIEPLEPRGNRLRKMSS